MSGGRYLTKDLPERPAKVKQPGSGRGRPIGAKDKFKRVIRPPELVAATRKPPRVRGRQGNYDAKDVFKRYQIMLSDDLTNEGHQDWSLPDDVIAKFGRWLLPLLLIISQIGDVAFAAKACEVPHPRIHALAEKYPGIGAALRFANRVFADEMEARLRERGLQKSDRLLLEGIRALRPEYREAYRGQALIPDNAGPSQFVLVIAPAAPRSLLQAGDTITVEASDSVMSGPMEVAEEIEQHG